MYEFLSESTAPASSVYDALYGRQRSYPNRYTIGKNGVNRLAVNDAQHLGLISGLAAMLTASILLGIFVAGGFFAGIVFVVFVGVIGEILGSDRLEWPLRLYTKYSKRVTFTNADARAVYKLIKQLHDHPDVDKIVNVEELVDETIDHLNKFLAKDSGYTDEDLIAHEKVLRQVLTRCDAVTEERRRINALNKPGSDVAKSAITVADNLLEGMKALNE